MLILSQIKIIYLPQKIYIMSNNGLIKQVFMKKIHILITSLFLLGAVDSSAQQNPQYTQYMYNMSVVNPAYAGSKDAVSMGALYRKQWVGLDGAPETGTFFINSRVGKKVGLGLSFITDKIGPVTENNVYGDFSYTLELGGVHKLALGVKAGATFHSADLFSKIGYGHTIDADDPAFGEDSKSTFLTLESERITIPINILLDWECQI